MTVVSPVSPLPRSPDTLPAHVAIIMDGNGRWATARGLPRVLGHKRGVETLRRILEASRTLGIRHMTLYAFSAENWKRPFPEISELMDLLRFYLTREIGQLHRKGTCLRVIGDRALLAPDIREKIAEAEALTQHNDRLYLTIALSYGARQEILQAARAIAERVESGELKAEAIDEALFASHLYTNALPDPDLLIRTGGEQRLSNFLLWQSAYAELYFTPVLWPDFTPEHLEEAIDTYSNRERRYGTTNGTTGSL
jgi:undecaprenyl diphosphate synthase